MPVRINLCFYACVTNIYQSHALNSKTNRIVQQHPVLCLCIHNIYSNHLHMHVAVLVQRSFSSTLCAGNAYYVLTTKLNRSSVQLLQRVKKKKVKQQQHTRLTIIRKKNEWKKVANERKGYRTSEEKPYSSSIKAQLTNCQLTIIYVTCETINTPRFVIGRFGLSAFDQLRFCICVNQYFYSISNEIN